MPQWQHQDIVVPNYQTKSPITLYWRDGLEVVEHLFSNPVFATCMQMTPYRAYDGQERMYGEFMSAEFAWEYQVRINTMKPVPRLMSYSQSQIPRGHSFIGVIGASDKTPLTIGTGNKEMHPLLLSLANIESGVRMKATSHALHLSPTSPSQSFSMCLNQYSLFLPLAFTISVSISSSRISNFVNAMVK